MPELPMLALSWLGGGALGASFFGGLWWTVKKSVSSLRPALWLFGSLLVRMSILLVGLYFVSGRDWKRLVACLLGVMMARAVVTWLTGSSRQGGAGTAREASHAPYPR